MQNGQADAAAIDSNALRYELRRNGAAANFRVLESWGPFPIQPVVIRTAIPAPVRESVRAALLRAHEDYGEQLQRFGYLRFADAERAAYTSHGHAGADVSDTVLHVFGTAARDRGDHRSGPLSGPISALE